MSTLVLITFSYDVKQEMFSHLLVDLSLCLLTRVLKNVHKFFGGVSIVTGNNCLDFESDLHSGVDPGILFLLCLLALCKTAVLVILVMSLISVLCIYVQFMEKCRLNMFSVQEMYQNISAMV